MTEEPQWVTCFMLLEPTLIEIANLSRQTLRILRDLSSGSVIATVRPQLRQPSAA